jgi:hypothetical protein
MPLYHGWAKPIDGFDSHLEKIWYNTFTKKWKWPVIYTGRDKWWADFKVRDVNIETKPEGKRFLPKAVLRKPQREALLIVLGKPGRNVWWYSPAGKYVAYRFGHPNHVEEQVDEDRMTLRLETPEEFITRSLREREEDLRRRANENSAVYDTD